MWYFAISAVSFLVPLSDGGVAPVPVLLSSWSNEVGGLRVGQSIYQMVLNK